MSFRSVQLGTNLCDQDKLILDLFAGQTVRYVGHDIEFQRLLNTSPNSPNLILILNTAMWCSDVVRQCQLHLTDATKTFYIGANRYSLLGNDTLMDIATTHNHSQDYLAFLSLIVSAKGFEVTKSGSYDNDLGRCFNFVQPLTWIYGTKVTDQSH